MNMIRKLRIQFVCVFMVLMLLFAAGIGSVVYFEQRAEMEYQCMAYLLDIHNLGNKASDDMNSLATYPPYFVIEIDNVANSAQVVLGRFFLGDRGVTTDELISHLIGKMEESGVLEEYQVRYFNGVREVRSHRISFIDVSYITNELHRLLGQITLFVLPSLAVLFFVALLLSKWFVKPAKQALDEQTRFVSKVSHELKTPLSIISANIDLLKRGPDVDEIDFMYGCESVEHECQRMSSLIEVMLWTALPAQTTAETNTTVDLTKLLQQETLRFEVVAFDQGLSLALNAEEGLSLTGNETQLTRLIDLIVENAIKYCTPGGEIQVTAEHKQGIGRKIRLCFANTGQALTKEQTENIFKPFYQVDGTKTGAGLGLSIAHEIVSAMHGTIRAEHHDGKNVFIIDL